jgi:hypothetical protein
MYSTTLSTLERWAPIPLRLIVGYGFMVHGYAKISKGPERFVDTLLAIGVPADVFSLPNRQTSQRSREERSHALWSCSKFELLTERDPLCTWPRHRVAHWPDTVQSGHDESSWGSAPVAREDMHPASSPVRTS